MTEASLAVPVIAITASNDFSIANATPAVGELPRQGKAGDLTLVAAVGNAPSGIRSMLGEFIRRTTEEGKKRLFGQGPNLAVQLSMETGDQVNGRSATCPT